MTGRVDPFAHHPELRDRIADPETSFFRTLTVEGLLRSNPELGHLRGWVFSDMRREAIRREALRGHSGDLWVFAYGSLMWDPAIRFADVRRAHAPHHERQFILRDTKGARGTQEAPGMMAALDAGGGCDGLAFRISADNVDTETEILFRREMIGPGYHAVFIEADIGEEAICALTFLADHGSPDIHPDISRSDQVRHIATGKGFLGTSRQYLVNVVDHFRHLGIVDRHCADLLVEVDAYIAAHGLRGDLS